MFPHLPNAVYPTLQTASLFILLDNSHYPNQMAYFNDYASSYPTSSAREESNAACQFLDQTLTTEGAKYEGSYITFTDPWSTFEQPGPTVGSPRALPDMTGYSEYYCNIFVDWCLTLKSPDSLDPATQYTTNTNGYDQPAYSDHYWSTVGQQAQFHHSGSLSQDVSFTPTVTSETPTAVHVPSSSKNLLYFQISGNRVLTDYQQSCSTTGGKTRAGLPPARSIR